MTIEQYLDLQEAEINKLKEYRKQFDEAELNYDSAFWKALQDYMATPDAKATLADKAAKANIDLQAAKRIKDEMEREVCACQDSIKLLQNRYEAEKLIYKATSPIIGA